jgi:hypothetical protein
MEKVLVRKGGKGFEGCLAFGNFEVRWTTPDKGTDKKHFSSFSLALEKYQHIEAPAQLWDYSSSIPVLVEEKDFK